MNERTRQKNSSSSSGRACKGGGLPRLANPRSQPVMLVGKLFNPRCLLANPKRKKQILLWFQLDIWDFPVRPCIDGLIKNHRGDHSLDKAMPFLETDAQRK